MNRYWLESTSTSVILGDNVKEITLGESERAFTVAEFARSNGGYLKGIGNYSPKEFSFVRDDFITTSIELHAWNQARNTFVGWFTFPVYKDLYLKKNYYNGTTYIGLQTLVYPLKLPEDNFNETWNTNFGRSFELISPSGVWEDTVATTGTTTITSTSEQAVELQNDGLIEAAPTFSFTPEGAGVFFQVKLAEGYGFRLEGTFSSGVTIDYNMKNGELKINDAMVNVSQYLTDGSPFLFPPNVSTFVYVTASSGIFGWSFSERYI